MNRSTDSRLARSQLITQLRTLPPIFAVISACLLGMFGVDQSVAELITNRPVTLGLALAYPSSSHFAVPKVATEALQFDVVVPVQFHISAEGKVTDVRGNLAEDTSIVRSMDSSLRRLVFVPGEDDSVKCSQILPAEVLLHPNSTVAVLRTPVNDSGLIESQDLYLAGIVANGAMPPALLQLAPYFLAHPEKDSLKQLPYALLTIELDASGRQQRVEAVKSTLGGFTSELESAFNWARFAPATKGKRRVGATIYATVIYHPYVQYPTAPLTLTAADSLGTVERRLIRLTSNPQGIMIPPLPRASNADSMSISRSTVKSFGLVSMRCRIDTTAAVWISQISSLSREVSLACREAVSELRFYPAVDFEGKRIEFDGLIYLDFTGSGIIRVYADWLRKPGSPPIR